MWRIHLAQGVKADVSVAAKLVDGAQGGPGATRSEVRPLQSEGFGIAVIMDVVSNSTWLGPSALALPCPHFIKVEKTTELKKQLE